MQYYKNVYFPDCPPASSGRSSLTLAFGSRDLEVYEAIRHLSSETLRLALGHQTFRGLHDEALKRDKTLNALCLSILRKRLDERADSQTPYLPGMGDDNPIVISPIQATFNGGRHEPLHEWYPYLEGYSPSFVETIIGQFYPDADRVLDPFAGAGTTPLTAERLGKTAHYCEINPVLQFLIESKVIALRLREKERAAVVARLAELSVNISETLKRVRADARLRQTYSATFRESTFFDDDIYEDVLRLRTLVDDLYCTDRHSARLLAVAILASLVPASRLIRRGDVRFKTERELTRGRIELRQAVSRALARIADDIQTIPPCSAVPLLVLENAKNLDSLPTLGSDLVITSPPYLNGTNYFRNTKLELWFLRCLNSQQDLARFRFHAMTVGINDVTVAKPIGTMPSSARSVVKQLEANAYDPRIPSMVACFASEMHFLLQSLARHLRASGKIAIDIGDSAYAGVHVPTDRFLIESLDCVGFHLTHESCLRQRYSRSRMKLTQKLLVFERKSGPVRGQAVNGASRRWRLKWNAFKDTLPHQRGEYAKRNWGHPLHSLCSYQGKMKPSLASHLVRTFTSPGEKLVDPFAGVGTIGFEAALNGVESWNFDISPPAVQITAAKVGVPSRSECVTALTRIETFLRRARVSDSDRRSAEAIKFNGPLPSYFEKDTFDEVLLARRYFLQNPPENASQSLILSSLLHILHGNRPYALSRRSHPITPFAPTGPMEYRPLMPRLQDKVERSLSCERPENFKPGHAIFQDATDWWPNNVADIDAVITSPPFFDSTRFYLGNWMRLWFCGWEVGQFQQKPLSFIDVRQKQGFEVYCSILRQCRERLNVGGIVVLHLGASAKCAMADELARVGRHWFRVSDVYTESVTHCESHGIRDKGTVVSHQYLVLE